MNAEKLAKMASQVRTGGKGSVRRKKKAIHKTTTTDDKRLQNTLKRLGVNNIPAIEEVNLFKDNGTVIHFNNPKGAFRPRERRDTLALARRLRPPRCCPGFADRRFPSPFRRVRSASVHRRQHVRRERARRDQEYAAARHQRPSPLAPTPLPRLPASFGTPHSAPVTVSPR